MGCSFLVSILSLAALAGFQASAGTIGTPGVPSGFGLAGGVAGLSISGSYGSDRGDSRFDASTALTFGFGNPVTGVGIQPGLSITSFRDFGASGYLSFGLHKMFQTSEAGIYSVALNFSHLASWGDAKRLKPGASLVGSYLTSFGSNLALVSIGLGTDMNDRRAVQGIVGIGMGLRASYAVGIGQVGNRTALGLTSSPVWLSGGSVSVSLNHDWKTRDTRLAVDLARSFNLFGN
jgi:hypothetical protein